MRLNLTSCSLLAFAASLSSATALTYKLAPNEKACFFTQVEQRNAAYAVGAAHELPVGGHGHRHHGDFVFTAQETGEYRICFNNEISTFTDKMVDFEITVRCSSSLYQSLSSPPVPFAPPPLSLIELTLLLVNR